MNTLGRRFRVTTFGESHGEGIGAVIDGCPAGLAISLDFVQAELDRRRPGQSRIVTQRKEPDTVELLSGVFEGVTTGAPLTFFIRNTDAKSKDYAHLRDAFRPSHADYTYHEKYGGHQDYRGGGRSSARTTAAIVAAGAVAKLLLQQLTDIKINAYVQRVGDIALSESYENLDLSLTETNDVRCPDPTAAAAMIALIQAVRKAGDTVGGVVQCVATACAVGFGEPLHDKLQARLAQYMLSIPAARGFEYGSGFGAATMFGSSHNDIFYTENDVVRTHSNNSGGIQGGITNGMPIVFKVAFKPVATIIQSQQTIDNQYNTITLEGRGRHDPCVLPRAVPIVEAYTALALADFYLLGK